MKKILLYAHDGVGYGHIARMASLAHVIKKYFPSTFVQFVSGYHNINFFLDEISGLDYVKLPGYNKLKLNGYQEKEALIDLIRSSRAKLIYALLDHIKYDYVIVDFFPFGTKDELKEILIALRKKQPQTKRILSQRGIAFSLEKSVDFFHGDIGRRFIDKQYDKIVCFCDHRVIDFNKEYFDGKLQIPVQYAGYLKHGGASFSMADSPCNVLVDFGGGFLCDNLLLRVVNILEKTKNSNVQFSIATGEYLEQSTLDELRSRFGKSKGIRILQTQPLRDLKTLSPNLVIGCGSYNVSVNALLNGIPLIIIPKDGTKEASIHSMRLSNFSSVKVLGVKEIEQLGSSINEVLNKPFYSDLAGFGKEDLVEMFDNSLV